MREKFSLKRNNKIQNTEIQLFLENIIQKNHKKILKSKIMMDVEII